MKKKTYLCKLATQSMVQLKGDNALFAYLRWVRTIVIEKWKLQSLNYFK